VLSRWLPGSINLKLGRSLILHGAVSTAIGFAAVGCLRVTAPMGEGLGRLASVAFWGFQVGLCIFVAAMLWWALGSLFKIPENKQAVGFITKKLRRSR
jgi:hypothetical protein